MMDFNKLLAGKVALITGAASGIGRATAQLFAQQGAGIAVADWNETGGRQTVASILAKSGDAIFVKTDVGVMADVSAAVKATLDRFGRIDIVHSNAASYGRNSATNTTEAEWDRTQAVCLKAAWMLAHEALPSMLKQEKGAFIITASVHSIRGYTNHVAYQAAKGGLVAMTRSLAADYAPKIRVNAILPGAVITGLAAGLSESDLERMANMCPLRRNAPPEDIATVALFLASDMSAYITGACIVADGGLSAVIKTE